MGKVIITIIIGAIMSIFFTLAFVIPYGFVAFVAPFAITVTAFIFFSYQHVQMGKTLVNKSFYCPYIIKEVDVKFKPGVFTFRNYDDVIKCSAFNGKFTCLKKCLDTPEIQNL